MSQLIIIILLSFDVDLGNINLRRDPQYVDTLLGHAMTCATDTSVHWGFVFVLSDVSSSYDKCEYKSNVSCSPVLQLSWHTTGENIHHMFSRINYQFPSWNIATYWMGVSAVDIKWGNDPYYHKSLLSLSRYTMFMLHDHHCPFHRAKPAKLHKSSSCVWERESINKRGDFKLVCLFCIT